MNVTILGDSFVADDFQYQYLDKSEPKNRGWSRLLANDSGISIKNKGISGSGPYYTLNWLKNNNNEGILILCLSGADRFRTILSENNPALDSGLSDLLQNNEVNWTKANKEIFDSKDKNDWKKLWLGMCNHNDFDFLYDGIVNTARRLSEKYDRVLLMSPFDLDTIYASINSKKIVIPQHWTILPIRLNYLAYACTNSFRSNIRPNHFSENINKEMFKLIKNWIHHNELKIPLSWKTLIGSTKNGKKSNVISYKLQHHN